LTIHLSEGTIVTFILAAIGYLISIGIWLVKMKWDVKENKLQTGELMKGFKRTVGRFGRLAKEFHERHAALSQKVEDHIVNSQQEHDRFDSEIKNAKE
jgi:hypothetical protein